MWPGHSLRPTTNHRGLQAFLGPPRGPGCPPLASQRLLRPFGAHQSVLHRPLLPAPGSEAPSCLALEARRAPPTRLRRARGRVLQALVAAPRRASLPRARRESSLREGPTAPSPRAPPVLSVPEDAVLDGFTPLQFLVFRWG